MEEPPQPSTDINLSPRSVAKKNHHSTDLTGLSYRKELTECKGNIRVRKPKKKSEAYKKKRALKRSIERSKLIKEGKLPKPKRLSAGQSKKPPAKKLELCRSYLNGFCPRQPDCKYMHDFPCKFYHTGLKCFLGPNCRFSHARLTRETAEILKNMMAGGAREQNTRLDAPGKRKIPSPAKNKDDMPSSPHNEDNVAQEQTQVLQEQTQPVLEPDKPAVLNFYVDMLSESSKPKENLQETPEIQEQEEVMAAADTATAEPEIDDIWSRKRHHIKPVITRRDLLPVSINAPKKEGRDNTNQDVLLLPTIPTVPEPGPGQPLTKAQQAKERHRQYLLKNFDVVGMLRAVLERQQKSVPEDACDSVFGGFWKTLLQKCRNDGVCAFCNKKGEDKAQSKASDQGTGSCSSSTV